jgi:DNA-binding transcriptional ArsR family regulator
VSAADAPWEAFADPTRRSILRLLGERGEMAAGAIAAELTMVGRTAVSAQLRVLRSAGLIAERRSGRQRFYAIQPGAADELATFLRELYPDSLDIVKLDVMTSEVDQLNLGQGAAAASNGTTGHAPASTRPPVLGRVRSSERAGREVVPLIDESGSESSRATAFADADEVYTYLGAMFSRAVEDPFIVQATQESGLVVLVAQFNPTANILIDFPGHKVVFGDAAADAPWTVRLQMSSNNSNRFWQGHLNLTLAMAQRRVKLDGKRSVALKLIALNERLFAAYRQTLRDAGRDDLLV